MSGKEGKKYFYTHFRLDILAEDLRFISDSRQFTLDFEMLLDWDFQRLRDSNPSVGSFT